MKGLHASRCRIPALFSATLALTALSPATGIAQGQGQAQVDLPPPVQSQSEDEAVTPRAQARAQGKATTRAGANAAPGKPAVPPPPLREAASGGAVRASEHTAFGSSGSPPPASATNLGFDYGSYGRVGIGSDLRGHTGHGVNVVSFGSRLEKPTYLELNFYYGGTIGEDPSRRWRVIVVPAFAGDLFHFSGKFSQNFALRNAYAEVENLGVHGLRLWAGSRMYRGDDVYLLDFWPLDNLNTVGGGAGYRFNQERTDLAVHLGMNRLDDLFQYQQVQVPARRFPQGGPFYSDRPAVDQVTTLDRPRLVASFKATQFLRRTDALPNGKAILYAEFHYLPEGQQQFPSTSQPTIPLKSEIGWVVGGQLGGWLRPFVFANAFVRVAGGLGAFGDLGKPYGFDAAQQATSALETTIAFSANYESRYLGVMGGGYFRHFRDANNADNTGFNEGALSLRPTVYFTRYLHGAVELSYQARRPLTADQERGTYLLPQVFRASVMPIVAPLGRGTYSRPMVYGIYTASVLSDDAQYTLFDPRDVRAGQGVVHYLGLGAEWWFNSSYR
jgi:maltoporin